MSQIFLYAWRSQRRRGRGRSPRAPSRTEAGRSTNTHAVKSALPDAAREVSGESLLLQTAPLCPMKVPIQSPVHSRSMGFPSLQLEMRTYLPSSCSGEKERWVTGRVCPGATRGTDFGCSAAICRYGALVSCVSCAGCGGGGEAGGGDGVAALLDERMTGRDVAGAQNKVSQSDMPFGTEGTESTVDNGCDSDYMV